MTESMLIHVPASPWAMSLGNAALWISTAASSSHETLPNGESYLKPLPGFGLPVPGALVLSLPCDMATTTAAM